jgi:uncharacterized protein YegL
MNGGDASGQTRIDVANEFVPAIIEMCEESPTIGDRIWVSLISFDQTARTVVPLGRPADLFPVDTLRAEGTTTAFGPMFRHLRGEITEGIATLVADDKSVLRPVVFIVTDGEALDGATARQAAFAELTDANGKGSPNVVVFGVGDATMDSIKGYAHRYGQAIVAKAGVSAVSALREMIPAMAHSLVAGATSGEGFVGIDEDDLDDEKFDSFTPASVESEDLYD